jgi:hypothetical protein
MSKPVDYGCVHKARVGMCWRPATTAHGRGEVRGGGGRGGGREVKTTPKQREVAFLAERERRLRRLFWRYKPRFLILCSAVVAFRWEAIIIVGIGRVQLSKCQKCNASSIMPHFINPFPTPHVKALTAETQSLMFSSAVLPSPPTTSQLVKNMSCFDLPSFPSTGMAARATTRTWP